jgi:hypothetical protein
MTSYFKTETETLVRIDGEEFVILGDEATVSDDELMALYEGNLPAGWSVAP